MHEELETNGSEIKDLSDETSSAKFVSFFNFCTRELPPLSPVKSYHYQFYNENGHGHSSSGFNFKKIIDLDSQHLVFPKGCSRNNDMIESLMHDSIDLSPTQNKNISAMPRGMYSEGMEDSGQAAYNSNSMEVESDANAKGNKTNLANKPAESSAEPVKKKGAPLKNKQKVNGTSDESGSVHSLQFAEKTAEKKKKSDAEADQVATGKKGRDGKNLKTGSPVKSPKSENKKKSSVNNEEHVKASSDKKTNSKTSLNPQIHREFYKKQPFSKNGTFGCKCKKTKCLKLYCECFSNKELCKDTCSCQDCLNKFEEDNDERDQAIHNLLMKNPEAFTSKIITPVQGAAQAGASGLVSVQPVSVINGSVGISASPFSSGSQGAMALGRRGESSESALQLSVEMSKSAGPSKQLQREESDEQKSNVERNSGDDRKIINKKGCHCKKSSCRKKYCECFGAGILCSSETCKCEDCKNGKENGGEGKSENGETQTVAENEVESLDEGRKKKQKLNSGEELPRPLEAPDK